MRYADVIAIIQREIEQCDGDEDMAIENLTEKAIADIDFRIALMRYAELSTETVH